MGIKKLYHFPVVMACILSGIFFALPSMCAVQQEREESDRSGIISAVREYGKESQVNAENIVFSSSNKNTEKSGDLFLEYIMQCGEVQSASAGRNAGNRLSGADKALYDILLGYILEVASGNRASTVFEISVDALRQEQLSWTAEELGLDCIVDQYGSYDAAEAALNEKHIFDYNLVLDALLADCPYNLYWYDKTDYTVVSGFSTEYFLDEETSEYRIGYSGMASFSFPVACEYSAGAYLVDSDIGQSVQTIIENAQSIVDECSILSDYEKLDRYREKICELVSYDENAAYGNVPYGNPWQIIWVFDEDPDTNVVCEGYAKAFQYLCNLTDFESDIECITVTGSMSGGIDLEEDHMWNIVKMEDGNNYLADLTNCDTGAVGADASLFLAGAAQDRFDTSCYLSINGYDVIYTYDYLTTSLYGPDELSIFESDYPEFTYPQEQYEENGIVYLIERNKATIIGYNGKLINIQIPDRVNGAEVIAVEEYAFCECYTLETVILPDSIIRIGAEAFSDCHKLNSINIPLNLEYIGEWAFFDCFELEGEVYIPERVSYIEGRVFPICTKLEAINVSEKNPFYTSIDGVLFSKDKTVLLECPAGKQGCFDIPASVVEIGCRAFYHCRKLEGTIEIPQGVKYIYGQTFEGCNSIDAIILHEGLEYIGEYAFDSCDKIQEIHLPSSVKTIERGIVRATRIREMDLRTVEMHIIPEQLFELCEQLEKVLLPDSITGIGERAFAGCRNLELDIGDILTENITYLGASAFEECRKITGTAVIPDGREKIYYHEFHGCALLEGVVMPDSVEEIEDLAFEDCTNLINVVFGKNVTLVGRDAFHGTAWLRSRGGTTVINGVLVDCNPDPDEFEIPSDVSSISEQVLIKLKELPGIRVSTDNPYLKSVDGVLFSYDGKVLIAYPSRQDTAYNVPEGVEEIGDSAFGGALTNSFVTDIVFPDSLKVIGADAFRGCSGLESITIPDSVIRIESAAFYECRNLKNVVIGNGVKCIQSHVFAWCENLRNLILPASLEYIEMCAFYECRELVHVEFPDSLKGIAFFSFENCPNLSVCFCGDAPVFYSSGEYVNGVYEPDLLYRIHDQNAPFGKYSYSTILYVKEGSEGFEDSVWEYYQIHYESEDQNDSYEMEFYGTPDFSLPASVTSIEESAFEGGAMAVIYIPDGCTSIGAYAFKDCKELVQIRIPSGCVVDDRAFDGCGTVYIFSENIEEMEAFCRNHENCLFVKETTDQ